MLSPEQFAILPWSWVPADSEVLRGIRECGFDLAGFVSPEALDAVQAAGLKAIVSGAEAHVGDAEAELSDEEVERRVRALVSHVGRHPATSGITCATSRRRQEDTWLTSVKSACPCKARRAPCREWVVNPSWDSAA